MRKSLIGFLLVAAVSLVAVAVETLDVYFIDVGHGDAILVDCGTWEMLIDAGGPTKWCTSVCGKSGECSGYCIGCHMPFLADIIDDELDLAVLTHNHEDHFGGFGLVFDHFEIAEFYYGETLTPNDTAKSFDIFKQQLEAQPFSPQPLRQGDKIKRGSLLLTVLNPDELTPSSPDHNNNSLVLLLEYGDVAFLFTGDIQTPIEGDLQRITLPDRCLVLKVPHHGSQSSTSLDFLKWANPELAIISCDSDDLDDRVTLDLGSECIPYLQTWSSGTICVSTDGDSILVSTDALSEWIVNCAEDELSLALYNSYRLQHVDLFER